MKEYLIALSLLANANLAFSQTTFDPQQHRLVTTDREDGRYISTYGVVHNMLKNTTPKCAFNPNFSHKQFVAWRKQVRSAMEEIMCHPKVKNQPKPIRVAEVKKDGYSLETWEAYPFEGCVTRFKVMIPDGLKGPTPAVLCIPGSGSAKEHLTGEKAGKNQHTAMALNMVRHGYIAVAVDNACAGEASDLEHLTGSYYDYETPSRFLLELGWSWLGYTSYLDKLVLEWMKQQPSIRRDRIVVSGFSLGTEPLMVLGVMDPSIYAFVYNDFLCQTQERAVVMTAPGKSGYRPFPNSIRHLIPRFWEFFNFTDIVASLAPRPIIFTEGGLDRDFKLVKRAYEISGNPDGMVYYHYPMFESPEKRSYATTLPEGLNGKEYFNYVNVDPPNHYFKEELVLPWLDKIM